MARLRFVLGDQLTRDLSSLRDLAAGDVVLMTEVSDEATYVHHHQRKIAFLFSAMRHFAGTLRAEGVVVDYVTLDDAGNTGSFTEELRRALQRHAIEGVVVTEAAEWRVVETMTGWEAALGILPFPRRIKTDRGSSSTPRRWILQHMKLPNHFSPRGRVNLKSSRPELGADDQRSRPRDAPSDAGARR